MTIQAKSINELSRAAKSLLEEFPSNRIFLFSGQMGAGKTTFIHKICEQLGVEEHTSSPTFSIVNEYASKNGIIYHFDFYRLKSESEALDIGYEDYFYSGNYCFVEWPEKISSLLPDDIVEVTIHISEDKSRIISAQKK